MPELKLKPVQRATLRCAIVGLSPLIQHRWSDKARRELEDKHGGKRTKNRDARDPEAEAESATYRTADGGYGVPVSAVKDALVSAAHKDLGVDKVRVQKALFLLCDDLNSVLAMECSEPRMRQDFVRVPPKTGKADLRYRPEFTHWRIPLAIQFDEELLQVDDIANLIDRAGFGVGIGEWRPERKGEHGRFQLDRETEIEVSR